MGILAYNPKGFFAIKTWKCHDYGITFVSANNFEVPIIPRSFSIREYHFAALFQTQIGR